MAKINLHIQRKVFNDAYYPALFDYSMRYEVYYGGAGSGKSVFVAQKLIAKACASKRKVLVIRRYGTTVENSVYSLLVETLKTWGLAKYCKFNGTKYRITLPNGSCFICSGLDDEEKIKSITGITDIWAEEATELSASQYTQLDLRLRAKVPNLQLFASFNPVSKANWVFAKWFSPDAEYNKQVTYILKTTYKDNRFLTPEYVQALEDKQREDITYYRIYALGEFCSLDKLIFSNWEVRDFDHAQIQGKLCVGLDFGFVNDPSALVASILCEETKEIYIFKEWGDTNKTNPELAAIIKALGFAKSVIIADSAEQKSITELKHNGITRVRPCEKGADSIIHGIQRLKQYRLILHPTCTELKTELENYSWTKDRKTGEYINKPIDEFNHYIDALRYSLQCTDSKQLKTMSKQALGL